MNIHTPTPSLLDHTCGKCGARDSDPTWHRQAVATVSPRHEHDWREGWGAPGTGSYMATYCLTCGEVRNPEPRAVARRTDPSTSWEAARSVTHIRESQQEVLDIFREYGPTTDELAFGYYRSPGYEGRQSVSGFRTRRSELVAKGLLRDTGERRRGSTGRRMIVWAAA